jgi:putative Mg2+ transporter-C (MgtC) family protein
MIDLLDLSQPQVRILAYVALAALLGALIGIDRELADKPAGLRTHILVASSAALLVGLSDVAAQQFTLNLGDSVVRTDPIRIIEAVITGVTFLGAGTIIRHGNKHKVEGLTTAASILVAAAVGICVALSQMVLAIGTTVMVLIALRGIKILENWLDQR